MSIASSACLWDSRSFFVNNPLNQIVLWAVSAKRSWWQTVTALAGFICGPPPKTGPPNQPKMALHRTKHEVLYVYKIPIDKWMLFELPKGAGCLDHFWFCQYGEPPEPWSPVETRLSPWEPQRIRSTSPLEPPSPGFDWGFNKWGFPKSTWNWIVHFIQLSSLIHFGDYRKPPWSVPCYFPSTESILV